MTPIQISITLSVGSLALGLGSWIFAVLAISAHKAIETHRRTIFSFIFCIISLVLQLFEVGNRVSIGDYAAIEDTIRAVLFASVALIAITVTLNALAYRKARKVFIDTYTGMEIK